MFELVASGSRQLPGFLKESFSEWATMMLRLSWSSCCISFFVHDDAHVVNHLQRHSLIASVVLKVAQRLCSNLLKSVQTTSESQPQRLYSNLLKLASTCDNLFRNTQNCSGALLKVAPKCSKCIKHAQSCTKLFICQRAVTCNHMHV